MPENPDARDRLCPILKTKTGDPRCCLGPNCGWWDAQDEACSVISIKDSLRVIAEAPALHEEG